MGTFAARAWLERLFGLRHHAVVGRYHQHGDVGDVGPAGPHFRKSLVAGRIHKGDRLTVVLDAVGADALGDAAGLALGHFEVQNPVQQRGFAVVHVPQEGDHRRARLQLQGVAVGGLELLQQDGLRVAELLELDRHAQLGGQQFSGLAVDRRVLVHHAHAKLEQHAEHVAHGATDGLSEAGDRARQFHYKCRFAFRRRVAAGVLDLPTIGADLAPLIVRFDAALPFAAATFPV